MQAVLEATFTENNVARSTKSIVRGRKVGILGSLFGCWHKRLTRPFSDRNTSYRACLDCGARRTFDTNTFKTTGSYYFPEKM